MAKIDRYDGNVQAPASNAVGAERTVFGAATQSDTLDANVTADLLRGWGIVGPNDFPTRQDFNALAFTLGQFIAYLHQSGIAEWNTSQEYHSGGMCRVGQVIYVSQTNSNTGNDPTTDDGTDWLSASAKKAPDPLNTDDDARFVTPAGAYELSRPKWYDADLVGTKLALGAVGDVAMAYIGGDNVAFYDTTNENLVAYTWSDATSSWAQSGNPLTITSTATPSMAAIAKDTVAFGQRNGTDFELSTYAWDGTNWSKTGNTLVINIGAHTPYMAALSSATVAVAFSSANEIRAFGWDGTDWTQSGNTLSIPAVGSGSIAALTDSRICVASSSQETLQSYEWDGTDFSAAGASLDIGANPQTLTAISDTDLAAVDSTGDVLVVYGETGSGWRTFDLSFAIDNVVAPSITAVSRTGVAVVDTNDENLARYELKSITSAAPVSASIVA